MYQFTVVIEKQNWKLKYPFFCPQVYFDEKRRAAVINTYVEKTMKQVEFSVQWSGYSRYTVYRWRKTNHCEYKIELFFNFTIFKEAEDIYIY